MAANECTKIYFLDVGQGTSQVIAFDDGSLVIIDCGASADSLVMLLKSIHFTTIREVILSHWHDDHVNGTPAVINNFANRIERFLLPQDQPAENIQGNAVFRQICQLKEDRRVTWGIDRLEYRDRDCGRIYSAPSSPDGPVLSVLYPSFPQSIHAQSQKDSNQGSGVLVLEHGQGKILFPGDAGKKAFKALVDRTGSGPIRCDILAAPHHSGKLSKGTNDFTGFRNCFHWLYQDVVQAEFVVVSAGTDNRHGHPNAEHLMEAVKSGAKVVCTQMTHQCHRDLNKVGRSLLPNLEHAAACQLGRGVGCGGTIVAELRSNGVSIRRFSEHQQQVDRLAAPHTPLCRK